MTFLGKSCTFGLRCVVFVNVYQFVGVFFPFSVLGWHIGFDVFTPDYCF